MPSKPRTMTLVLPPARLPLAAQAATASTRDARRSRPCLVTGELFLVERLSVHVGGWIQSEEAEHGGCDVHQGRIVAVDLAAGEEHAGHQPRIDAVIAAPRLDVVLEDRPRDDAGGAVPRGAIAGVEADQEVGRVLEIRTAVERRGGEGLVDGHLARLLVAQPREGRHHLALE